MRGFSIAPFPTLQSLLTSSVGPIPFAKAVSSSNLLQSSFITNMSVKVHVQFTVQKDVEKCKSKAMDVVKTSKVCEGQIGG